MTGNKTQAPKTLTLEDLLYFQKTVIEWNELFGNSVANKDLIEVYRKLSKEELLGEGELVDSYEKGVEEGIIDGLIDSIYTGFYWCSLKGYTIKEDDVWFSEGQWNSPCNHIETEALLHILSNCLKEDKPFDFQTYFVSLLYELSDKYDIPAAFNRITESNYSKALSKDNTEYTLQECLGSVKSIGRYEDIFVEETSTHYIIKARVDTQEGVEYPTGKIVKGIWYLSTTDLGGLEEFIK